MVQEIGNRLCWDVQGRSCVCRKDMSEEMGSNTDRIARPCCKRQTVEEKTQKIGDILRRKLAKAAILGCSPLKKVWLSEQIICLVAKRLRMHHRDDPTMGSLKHGCNLFQMTYSHIADEKKLPLTFVLVSFGQELLDEHAHFPARWLLLFEFINHDGLKTGSTDLKQFAHSASIGQGQRRQSRSKKRPSVEG